MKATEKFNATEIQEKINESNAMSKGLAFSVVIHYRFLVDVMNSLRESLIFKMPIVRPMGTYSFELLWVWGNQHNGICNFTARDIERELHEIELVTQFIDVKLFYYVLEKENSEALYSEVFDYQYEQYENIEDKYWDDYEVFREKGRIIK